MTEDQFRRAISAHVDAHLGRLDVTYAVLFNSVAGVLEITKNSGLSHEVMTQIIDDESERVEDALDGILTKYQRPQSVPVH